MDNRLRITLIVVVLIAAISSGAIILTVSGFLGGSASDPEPVSVFEKITETGPTAGGLAQTDEDTAQPAEESLSEEEAAEAAKAAAHEEALAKAQEKLDSLSSGQITLTVTGSEQETIDAETLAGWLFVDEEKEEVAVDEQAVRSFVDELAAKYDTVGQKVSFTTTEGEEITPSFVTFGWKMNRSSTTDDLMASLLGEKGREVSVTWSQKGTVPGSNEIGSSYVEIDLNRQHVWVYRNGEAVISTDCVSGKAIEGNATPNGLFYINFKEKDAVLRGEDYETPVSYWMPFYLGVGLHDAGWRGSFGGDIYVRSGSHGCVNLPPSQAAAIFDIVYTGEPVIVYGGMNRQDAQAYLEELAASEAEAKAEEAALQAAQDENWNAISDELILNYEALGMTHEQAVAQAQIDIENAKAQQAAAAAAAQDASAAPAPAAEVPAVEAPPAAEPTTVDPSAAAVPAAPVDPALTATPDESAIVP